MLLFDMLLFLIVACAPDGPSDRSQHRSLTSGTDNPSEQEKSPISEKTPKKETAREYSPQISEAEQNENAKKPSIKSSRELNGYIRDESIEPAQGSNLLYLY